MGHSSTIEDNIKVTKTRFLYSRLELLEFVFLETVLAGLQNKKQETSAMLSVIMSVMICVYYVEIIKWKC